MLFIPRQTAVRLKMIHHVVTADSCGIWCVQDHVCLEECLGLTAFPRTGPNGLLVWFKSDLNQPPCASRVFASLGSLSVPVALHGSDNKSCTWIKELEGSSQFWTENTKLTQSVTVSHWNKIKKNSEKKNCQFLLIHRVKCLTKRFTPLWTALHSVTFNPKFQCVYLDFILTVM